MRGHFSFHENGERFAMEAFAKWNAGGRAVIWDVGAHIGDLQTLSTPLRRAHMSSASRY
jgi:hypothetical protein